VPKSKFLWLKWEREREREERERRERKVSYKGHERLWSDEAFLFISSHERLYGDEAFLFISSKNKVFNTHPITNKDEPTDATPA
jgi:hypothetical protein